MKLSISNIAWPSEMDHAVYEIMKNTGFSALEIAPTRIFPEKPYEDLQAASEWAKELKTRYGFSVSSMQSIWYGVTEKLFGSEEERRYLVSYTKKAIDFAEAAECSNLVFGCPRNRSLPEGADARTAESFFREIADYAALHHTVIAMEANPPIYHTNYINTTLQALKLTETIASPGFKINLDVGTIVENHEPLSWLKGKVRRISHVHISEPGLKMIHPRPLHTELAELLRAEDYTGFVSIETGKTEQLSELEKACIYVKEIFG